jgi:hypothetical protein
MSFMYLYYCCCALALRHFLLCLWAHYNVYYTYLMFNRVVILLLNLLFGRREEPLKLSRPSYRRICEEAAANGSAGPARVPRYSYQLVLPAFALVV